MIYYLYVLVDSCGHGAGFRLIGISRSKLELYAKARMFLSNHDDYCQQFKMEAYQDKAKPENLVFSRVFEIMKNRQRINYIHYHNYKEIAT